MSSTPPYVLAVDPGGTTGFSIANAETGELQCARQLKPFEFCQKAHSLAADYGSLLTIVVERFTISQRTLKASRGGSYDALEVIGVLRYVSQAYCLRDIAMQQPADVMRLFPDEKLKALGWHFPGKPHANDACRHLAWWLAQHKVIRVP